MEKKESYLEEKLLKYIEVFKGKLLGLSVNKVELPDKNITEREVVSHPGAVAIVPITSKYEVVMVRQYRFAIGKQTLELPAGTLEEDEKPIICAKRELEEEIGMRAKEWERMISIYPSPGYCNEIIHIYLAKELEDLHKENNIKEKTLNIKKSERDEFINKVVIPLNEAKDKIFSGEITDAKTIIGILLATKNII